MDTKTLREQRAKLVSDFRTIYDAADKEGRTLNDAELAQAKAINADIERLKGNIDAQEQREALEREERAFVPESQRTEGTQEAPQVEYREALRQYLIHGASAMPAEARRVMQDYQARSQNTLTGAAGGFLVRPDTSLYTSIVEAQKFFGGSRNMGATILSTSTGADLPIPVVNDTSNEGTIVAEEGSHTGGTDVAVGQRVFKAWLYSSKIVRVSLQLLQDGDFPIEAFLGRIFGQRLGRVQNKHFTIGDSVSKPQGYVTAAPVGDQTSVNNAITFEDVLELIHSVDIAYRANGAFSMHDQTALALRKLKDVTSGRYLWEPGLQVGAPDRLFGYPVVINNDIPTIAASAKVMTFGDHSAYYIRDVRGIQVVRLNELYAETAQVGFMAFLRADGGLVDAGTGPIKALQMAS